MQSDNASMLETLTQRGAQTAMRWKRYGIWQTISGDAMASRVTSLAHGLRAIGFHDGDVAGIIGDNCAEWVLADLAIVSAGGVSAGFDAQSDFDELVRVLNETKTRILFVAGDVQLHKALTVRARCPNLQTLVVMHQQWDDGTEATVAMPLADLEMRGADNTTAVPTRHPDGPALVMYTSGMTGPARGAILSGRAVALQAARAAKALNLKPDDERLSLIPIHHVLERVVGIYASLLAGTIINFSESRETALANLVELQPTVILAVPRTWARLKGSIELAMAESTPFQRWTCRTAFASGGGLWDALVLAPVRRRIGLGRARLCLSGGAPLHDDIAAWFATLGCDLTDIYGHAETSGAVSVAGKTLDGHTINLDKNSAIAITSATLFSGYIEHTSKTATAVWHSGDIGARNENGLRAIGRSNDLLRSGITHVAPFVAERALTASPFIADAFLDQDNSGRIVAYILIESDAVVKYAQDHSIPFTHFISLCRSDDIRALIARAVADANAATDIEIADFSLIERALGPDDIEVSPALALRRYKLRDNAPDRAKDTAMLATLETTQP